MTLNEKTDPLPVYQSIMNYMEKKCGALQPARVGSMSVQLRSWCVPVKRGRLPSGTLKDKRVGGVSFAPLLLRSSLMGSLGSCCRRRHPEEVAEQDLTPRVGPNPRVPGSLFRRIRDERRTPEEQLPFLPGVAQ